MSAMVRRSMLAFAVVATWGAVASAETDSPAARVSVPSPLALVPIVTADPNGFTAGAALAF